MRSQKGFTLVEVLVMVAIGGVIITGVLASYQQVVSATMRNTRQTTAVSDVSTAALAIHKDLLMAQGTVDVPADGIPVVVTGAQTVTFNWINFVSTDFGGGAPQEGGTPHTSTYSLTGTTLTRNYDGQDIIVGRNVTYLAFARSNADDRLFTITITSTAPGLPVESETLVFTMYLRGAGV